MTLLDPPPPRSHSRRRRRPMRPLHLLLIADRRPLATSSSAVVVWRGAPTDVPCVQGVARRQRSSLADASTPGSIVDVRSAARALSMRASRPAMTAAPTCADQCELKAASDTKARWPGDRSGARARDARASSGGGASGRARQRWIIGDGVNNRSNWRREAPAAARARRALKSSGFRVVSRHDDPAAPRRLRDVHRDARERSAGDESL